MRYEFPTARYELAHHSIFLLEKGERRTGKVKDKYSLTVLHVACTPKEANNKKLPTNSYLVNYLDMKITKENEYLFPKDMPTVSINYIK